MISDVSSKCGVSLNILTYFPNGDGEFLRNVGIPAHHNTELSLKNINNINFSYEFLMAV
jgi:hypothetical protein